MKLTKREREELIAMALLPGPWPAIRTGPRKAICNKLMKKGLAECRSGYSIGYSITEAGRKALKEMGE